MVWRLAAKHAKRAGVPGALSAAPFIGWRGVLASVGSDMREGAIR
jgi:hypothetical protein